VDWLVYLFAIFEVPVMVIRTLITGDVYQIGIPEATPAIELVHHIYEVILGWFL